MDTMISTESYCRCGYETDLPDRFTFTTAQMQERRPSRWIYLVVGLGLQTVPLGATVWMLS